MFFLAFRKFSKIPNISRRNLYGEVFRAFDNCQDARKKVKINKCS